MKINVLYFLFPVFLLISCAKSQTPSSEKITQHSFIVHDSLRNRDIPSQLYLNTNPKIRQKRLVIINACYLCPNTVYSFLAEKLANLGYLVVAIQHELPDDEPIAREGDLYKFRMPVWERGVKNVLAVIEDLKKKYKSIDYQQLILVGHSNGGDISMLLSQKYPEMVSVAVSLDHRRMPIPRAKKPKLLSIRADEFEADMGVIPSAEEQKKFDIKIIYLKNVKHADLSDDGSQEVKDLINREVLSLLR